MRWAGEIAAVGTAFCWACAANLFLSAGRRMGSVQLNRVRLIVAALFLSATLVATRGAAFPTWATRPQLGYLALSGLAGFAFGDSLYFRGLVILGAGHAALLLSLAPVFAAIFARWWLGETLGPQAIVGMGVTLAGLVLVQTSRRQNSTPHREGSAALGVACGVLASVGAAAGYVLSKLGLQGGLDALSGTLVRVLSGAAAIWIVAPLQGGLRNMPAALRDRVALRTTVAGAVFGPFVGVTLSLFALQHSPAGIATSIFACSPIFAIALGTWFHREPLGVRMIVGASLAVGGVVLLFSHRA